jgi:hypothetical protein
MKIFLRFSVMAAMVMTGCLHISAQDQYINHKSMSQKINSMVSEYSGMCTVKSLVKTAGGKDIWVITVGTGNKDNKPGIAILGGIEGSHILGKELAFGFAELLLKNSSSPEIKGLLDKVTFYVFPDVSPDATEQFFAPVKYERIANSRSTDDDRDFLFNEDPFEDLNNDGLITLIRVSDQAGTFMESDEDRRIMAPAQVSKGQKGSYFVYSEGIDNDKDNLFNEDSEGGVSFNRNLSYNYEEFGAHAGLHAVSEPESKAVLDFLFDHFNIYATFAFGPQDNLGQPMKAAERTGNTTQSSQRPQTLEQGQFQGQFQRSDLMRMTGQERKFTSILKSDEAINKLVSEKYHEITGVKGAPAAKSPPGNFMEWAYFHYGRYSFSTPAWWFPVEREKNAEVMFLKFAEENKIEDVFVPWTEIIHPDFPDKKTETGGIRPFAMINPPAEKLEDLITKNYQFIITVAAMHPELEFLDINVEKSEGNLFRLTLKVHNKGIFATCAESGALNMWTRLMRIKLETSKNQKFLSGQPIQRLPRLEGGQSEELNWVILGKGTVKISAGAINTGIISTSAELK